MKIKDVVRRWEVIIFLLLILEILIVGIFNSSFLNIRNIFYSTTDFAHISLVALPLTLVIITGGIDISIASIMGLTSIVIGSTWSLGAPMPVAIVLGLLSGVAAGTFNGLLVANTDIQPLVITLGTMFLYSGIATGIAGSLGASGYNGIGNFPEGFLSFAYGSIGIIPSSMIYVILFAVFLGFILHRHRLGRSIYLIGVNKEAAAYNGIKVKKVIVIAYTLTGLGSAIAGILLTSYFTSARSDLGSEALLPAITAVVLGGTDILGGSGTVLGTFIAAFFLGVLKQGLMALGVTNNVSQVVIGLVLILAVAAKLGIVRYRKASGNKKVSTE